MIVLFKPSMATLFQMTLPLAIFFLLLLASTEAATVVMQAACWIVICSTPCAGIVVTALTSAPLCAACLASCFCFDESSTVMTGSGQRSMEEVEVGEKVTTLDMNGTTFRTEVEQKNVLRGNFSMVEISFASLEENGMASMVPTEPLLVSVSHPMLIIEEGGGLKVQEAASMRPGHQLRVSDGSLVQVSAVKLLHRPSKVVLVTEDCTILANGIYTATSCENPARSAELAALGFGIQHASRPFASAEYPEDEVSDWDGLDLEITEGIRLGHQAPSTLEA